jgi:hypothetical protein
MSEYTILYTAFGSMIGLSLACLLYALGGRDGKWKRRFIASLILAITVNLASLVMGVFSFWLFLAFPSLIVGFSMGYGADTLMAKIIRRSIYALSVIASGLIFCLVFGGNAWWVLPVHIGVGLFSIYLGVRNPLVAAAEEVFVCALLNIGLCAYPFIVR